MRFSCLRRYEFFLECVQNLVATGVSYKRSTNQQSIQIRWQKLTWCTCTCSLIVIRTTISNEASSWSPEIRILASWPSLSYPSTQQVVYQPLQFFLTPRSWLQLHIIYTIVIIFVTMIEYNQYTHHFSWRIELQLFSGIYRTLSLCLNWQ